MRGQKGRHYGSLRLRGTVYVLIGLALGAYGLLSYETVDVPILPYLLPAGFVLLVYGGVLVWTGGNRCAQCGRTVRPEVTVCPFCGHNLEQQIKEN